MSHHTAPSTTEGKLKKVLRSGTMAGVLTALLLILLFVLAATFLKSLVFGLILAYFCLPLEKFYEQKFFQWKWVNALWAGLSFLAFPFLFLQKMICGEKTLSEEEKKEKLRKNLVMRCTSCTVLTVIIVLIVSIFTLVWLLIPYSIKAGNSLKAWASQNPTVLQAEGYIIKWVENRQPMLNPTPQSGSETTGTAAAPKGSAVSSTAAPQKKTAGEIRDLRSFLEWLRPTLRSYAAKYQNEITKLLFTKGKGILSWIFSVLSTLGTWAFDLLMSVVFFYFFLQKMALFMGGEKENNNRKDETIGAWCVRGVFNSPWLPDISAKSKREAAAIIDRIAFMLKRWARGYLWIIIIEIILYMLAFSLFSVPYGLLLAIPSGLTILLPFFGLLGNIVLATVVCLIFCAEGTLVGTLIGVFLSYLLVNGILEQLFLYPSLVGGAIGLTLLETIVVVLLGGMMAGIPGMIFAVPAAAVMKFLIPTIYLGLTPPKEDPQAESSTSASAP